MDFRTHLDAVERDVEEVMRDGAPARAVTLRRTYSTTPDDLWQALTDKARLPRWFTSVDGDFHLHGRFAVTGNASGEILRCDPPAALALTWEMGDALSWVEVFLAETADGTELTLVHTAPVTPHWERFGPGAVGVGWDLTLLGLGLHIADPAADRPDPESFHVRPDGRAFIEGAGIDWVRADIASGERHDTAEARGAATIGFYTGETPPDA